METIRRPGRRPVAKCLGNFLSGMETRDIFGHDAGASCLGNFLSGMETNSECGGGVHRAAPLETSLVEWKRIMRYRQCSQKAILGNFLSGMETDSCGAGGGGCLLPWKLP